MTNNDMPQPVDLNRMEESLHMRISHLEREGRRMRTLNTIMGVGMVGAVALSIAASTMARAAVGREVLTAREVQLKDTQGVVRGTWRILDDGTTSFIMNDVNAIGRLKLTVLDNGGAGLAFTDGHGRSRVVLSLLPDMTGTLAFADETGGTRAAIGLTPDGSASAAFVDEFGNTRSAVGVQSDGSPLLTLNDRTPEPPDTTGSNRP
jgi:hypothetical protein